MKHILCYGDSNTHGYIPGGGRYDDDTRYTGILAKLLGSDYRIIEEGLNSRTSSFDDPFEPYKNGMDCLVPCCYLPAVSGSYGTTLRRSGFPCWKMSGQSRCSAS